MLQLLREFYGPILFPVLRIGGILVLGYIIFRLIDSALPRVRLFIPSADMLGVARVEPRYPV
jgi:hypothetical protein